MKCHNCSKPAMFGTGSKGEFPVCLDCYIKVHQVLDRQLEHLERFHNQIADQAEMATGFLGIVPRYPPRPSRVVLEGDVTLNNITISQSNIGVLNTGTVGTIDGAIGVLNGTDREAAQAVKAATEAIANATDLAASEKNRVLELISIVASEGAAPKSKRRGEAMRTILRDISSLLTGSAAVSKLWETLKPVIEELF